MHPASPTPPSGNSATWTGFLIAAFCVVGMIGLVASYGAPLPYQRELRAEAALDALPGLKVADRASLRDVLGDNADAVLTGDAPLDSRIAAARVAIRARFAREAAQTDTRLRLQIAVVTLMAAGFGAVTMHLARKA